MSYNNVMLDDFVNYLRHSPQYREQIVHYRFLPAQEPRYRDISLSSPVARALTGMGIQRLYSHQAESIEALRRGENIAVVTPTASGKTLVYNIPILEAILARPETRALYIFPLKALARDQQEGIKNLADLIEIDPPLEAEIYDGDTPSHHRIRIRRKNPRILITNPDMLHLGILPYHDRWARFFRHLRYIVIDELHVYRGIFGSHVAHVIRRLRRICELYGSSPLFIICSATIANPGELSEKITGLKFRVIDQNGAPQSARHIIFWNPIASPYTETTALLRECVERDLKTLVFTKARKITELIHIWSLESDPQLAGKISPYRAGYLPEERREIEQQLFEEELMGVVSTSALELGIDVGGLDVCILAGYPGTITSTWQRAGRVGRGKRDALLIMVALDDPLDQYFMNNPEDFFSRGFEPVIVDTNNSPILSNHLLCAAAENPLRGEDEKYYGDKMQPVLLQLKSRNKVFQDIHRERWLSAFPHPQRFINIRSIGENYTIVDSVTGEIIGETDLPRVYRECHPGAIYLHKGKQHQVISLEWETRTVMVKEVTVNYYTEPRSWEQIEILNVNREKSYQDVWVRQGEVRVTEQVTGYVKRDIHSQILLSEHPVQIPPHIFETIAIWWEMPSEIGEKIKHQDLDFLGGLHATEHAAIAVFPLFAMCDRWDIGGLSTPFHPQTGNPTIFIYDGYPGGVGLAERAYEIISELWQATLKMVSTCECDSGCPSCIQSPKCGSGNRPLDKNAAWEILHYLIEKFVGKLSA